MRKTVLCCLVLAACTASTQDAPARPWTKDEHIRMSMDLYSEILKEAAGKNVFVSPTSVALALIMTYNGAHGATEQDMAKALRIDKYTCRQVNEACASLLDSLHKADPEVALAIANSIWVRHDIELAPDFESRVSKSFAAAVRSLDFSAADASSIINSWVSQATREKIKEIVPKTIPSDAAVYLINAIYMKAPWTDKFHEKATRLQEFTRGDGTKKQHPLMVRQAVYEYQQNDEFQAIRLPYGKNSRLGMVVFLPKDLNKFHEQLTAENWAKWMKGFNKREVHLRLPKFKIECEYDLNSALKSMGMERAFSDRADFSGMVRNAPVYISKVKHKTYVDVKEEGTEAAAVTSVEMKSSSAPTDRAQMIVDRPFFCAVVDPESGAILFMGSITDPR